MPPPPLSLYSAAILYVSIPLICHPFNGDKETVDTLAEKAIRRLAAQATLIMRRQHRVHVFAFCIIKSTIRFLRFDRLGAWVSDPFDFLDNPTLLLVFVRALGAMSDMAIGLDETVARGNADDRARVESYRASLKDTFRRDRWHMKCIDHMLRPDHLQRYPLSKVKFTRPVEGGKGLRDVFVVIGRPWANQADRVIGRSTRVYIGLELGTNADGEPDPDSDCLVVIKDRWDYECRESQLCKEIRDVEHLPTYLYGGIIETHHNRPYFSHSRVAFKEVCRHLHEYEDAWELLRVVRQAVEGRFRATVLLFELFR